MSAGTKLNTSSIFFKIQTLIVKNIENKTTYSVQELQLCIFSSLARVILAIFISSTLSVHSSTNLSTKFFLHYSCYSQILSNITWFIVHTHNFQGSKQTLYCMHLYQSILCIHNSIYHHCNVVYYYKHLHLIYIHIYTFHAILCVLFHQSLTLD